MAAGGTDTADPTGRSPARDGLWIDPKQAGNLSGCEESVTVLHLMCLSSGRVLSSAFAGPQPDVYTLRAPASAFDPRKLRSEQKFRVVVNVRLLSVTKLTRNCIFWRDESRVDHTVLSRWHRSHNGQAISRPVSGTPGGHNPGRPAGPHARRSDRACMLENGG